MKTSHGKMILCLLGSILAIAAVILLCAAAFPSSEHNPPNIFPGMAAVAMGIMAVSAVCFFCGSNAKRWPRSLMYAFGTASLVSAVIFLIDIMGKHPYWEWEKRILLIVAGNVLLTVFFYCLNRKS